MSGHYPAVRRETSSLNSSAHRHWPRSAALVRSSPMEPSIYEYPDVFRRAHLESPGEIPAEVVFLQQVWKRHRKSRTRRILDIACGDSPHGRLLADDGFEVVGIDRSPTMIVAGRRKARALANLRFYRRPIEKFTLPTRAFDAAIFMSETFPVVVENANLLSHLK